MEEGRRGEMVDFKRSIVRHSVEDVIHILENEPVKYDMVPEVTVVQVMNRVSIAHLSIERALKFLITDAGGSFGQTHNLRQRYQELLEHDHVSAKSLEDAFQAAVRHYGYNPNAANMTHLKSLKMYLELVGSDRHFQDIRYWELTQSLDERLGGASLLLHIELLHALSEILLASDRTVATIVNRVEWAVEKAMGSTQDLSYGPGTSKEHSVLSYLEWRQGFNTWGEALAEAVKKNFNIGDEFLANLTRSAYTILLGAADPAVSYFASALDVLSGQPRDVIPCVEWLGPEKERYGSVKTPSGAVLGTIERGQDGLWYITPRREGFVRRSAKANSQTDARCYLAILLTRPARASVEGKNRSLRLVGEGPYLLQRNYDEINRRYDGTSDHKTWTHKLTLWDKDHGIDINNTVRVEVPSWGTEGLVHILKGTVAEVAEHEVYLSASEVFGREQKDQD